MLFPICSITLVEDLCQRHSGCFSRASCRVHHPDTGQAWPWQDSGWHAASAGCWVWRFPRCILAFRCVLGTRVKNLLEASSSAAGEVYTSEMDSYDGHPLGGAFVG